MKLEDVINKLRELGENTMADELNEGNLTLPFVNPEDSNDVVNWPIVDLVKSGTPLVSEDYDNEGDDMELNIPVINY